MFYSFVAAPRYILHQIRTSFAVHWKLMVKKINSHWKVPSLPKWNGAFSSVTPVPEWYEKAREVTDGKRRRGVWRSSC